ncbi:MAG: type I DNA topoisomerase [Bacteroidetes bacterium]|nr:type I DNA topoisomerase [Bacteroidota bacterium]
MSKNLIIVESPAKAKTINKFLGDEFVVSSSYGHIRDLPDKGVAIDIKNNYAPQYEVNEDKEKVIKELKKLAKGAKDIYLATDEDREGEAIAWHLCHVLDLDPKKAKRITYTEITEKAVKNAVANPRKINLDLVDAQQARRVLDRLVGYELSPVLWRKVRPSLSAGRVQSVAVRLIVEREREIKNFKSVSTFKITAQFLVKDDKGKTTTLKAESTSKFATESDANAYLNNLIGAAFSVKDIEKKPAKRTPSAPFTTSTLQQEASRKLGFSVTKTMVVAQKLYEAGHITYMRTDSTSLSDLALANIATEIKSKYGKEYHKQRQFATKNASAQEAHEAIRPSYIENSMVEGERDEQRLYELIWKRTIASQMGDADLERTIISIGNNKNSDLLQATGEIVVFDGFLKVYTESTDDDADDSNEEEEGSATLLPPLHKGDGLDLKEMIATERFSKPLPRYTEASLVKKLEELGIGRPSTYAPTIGTIQKRQYVVKEPREGVERAYRVLTLKSDKISKVEKTEITGAEKNKLFPTDIGNLVNDFLVENFNQVLDFGFTADVEKQFDEIAEGHKAWSKMIDEFYKPFHQTVETTTKESKKVTGERLLGEDPATGKPVLAKMGRYGAMIQIGATESEEKPRFAKLRANQSIETITFDEAMELFKLPREVGEYEGKVIKVSIGRFGPYVQHDSKFVSLKKEQDPYTITHEEAVELIKAKREADANKFIAEFKEHDIQILNGRFGPYIKKGKDNYKIPKGMTAEALTEAEVLEIVKGGPAKKSPRGRAKK